MRFYPDSVTGDFRVTIQRVIKKTPAIVRGAPAQLLHQALTKQRGLKVGCARLLVRRGAVYLAVPVITPVALPKLGNLHYPTVVGVDLGVNTLVAAVAITPDGVQQPARVVSGGTLKHRLAVLWGIRRRAHQNGANLEPIDAKIRQVIDYWVHLAARRVVEYAAQFPQPVVALEDLRSYLPYKRRTRWAKPALRDQLSKWARGKVSQGIKEKTALQAIPVVMVDAAYSSHFCPRGCLCRLPAGSRTRGKRWFGVFYCPACGVSVPRDVNAAIELAHRGLRLHQRTTNER